MATAKILTSKQVQTAFGVAHMTIHNWRKGTATKDPLPCELSDPEAVKPRISFRVIALKQWAKRNGVEFAVDPESLITEVEAPASKPGPKKRQRATAEH